MFLIDKYRPSIKKESSFHKDELNMLENMASDNSIPHLIFYGPEGAGKRTIIQIFLKMLYGDEINNITDSKYRVSGSGNTISEVIIKQSNYHIIIEPNNTNFDRYLIQDVVKDYAKKKPLSFFSSNKIFKTVLINNVDNLSYYAQTSLRRTMEKYSKTCRFIMWCKSLSKVIDPIRSRCYCFRIAAPSKMEIMQMISLISDKESIKLSLNDYSQMLDLYDGNIKKILWILELKKINESAETTYVEAINQIVTKIMQKKFENVLYIRDILYNIMITNITGTRIIKDIIKNILNRKNINNTTKFNIIENSAKYEHNLIRGRREIIHLDAFIVGLIDIL